MATIRALVRYLEYGYTAKAERQGGGPKFLRISDIENGLIDWSSVPRCTITDEALAKFRLEPGDIVFARTGSIEKACLIIDPPKAVFASYLIRGRPIELRTAPWLAAFVASFHYRNQAAAASAGVGRANVNAKNLGRIELRLPPLAEQHRIVVAIEAYLTRLDDAVATLERVQRALKRYRASVLKAAVEGRLAAAEAELARADGRNYESASVLLERILTDRRRRWEDAELARLKAKGKAPKNDEWKAKYKEPVVPDTSGLPDLPEGWCWASVDELEAGDRRSAYGVLVPGPDIPSGVPMVRVGDIHEGRIDSSHLKRISRDIADKFGKTYLRGGEILLTLVGTIGRTAVVPTGLAGANVARAVGVIPASDLVSSHWIELWFRSPATRHRMIGMAHEVARKTLNLEDVRSAPVALAPLLEQGRIGEAIADAQSIVDATYLAVEHAILRCRKLRQSILKWAFEGRLVDQDTSDEPASALLERLRAERQYSNDTRPRARGRRTPRAQKT